MAYYPSIDYMGMSNSILKNFEDLPRVDRELQQQQLREKQMTLYDLQMKKAQREADFETGLGDYYKANLGSLQPTTETITAPDYSTALGGEEYSVPGELSRKITRPPSKTIYGLGADYAMSSGHPLEAIKFIAEARKAEKDREEIFNHKMDSITKAANISPTWAAAMHKQLASQNPEMKMYGPVNFDKQGIPTEYPIMKDGVQIGFHTIGPDGKLHGSPTIYKEDKDPTPSLARMVNDEADQLIADRKLDPKDAPSWKVKRMSEATKEGKREFVFKPEGPTSDQKNLAQINAEEKATGQPITTMKEFLAGKKGPVKQKTGLGDLKTKDGSSGGKQSWKKWAQ